MIFLILYRLRTGSGLWNDQRCDSPRRVLCRTRCLVEENSAGEPIRLILSLIIMTCGAFIALILVTVRARREIILAQPEMSENTNRGRMEDSSEKRFNFLVLASREFLSRMSRRSAWSTTSTAGVQRVDSCRESQELRTKHKGIHLNQRLPSNLLQETSETADASNCSLEESL